MRSGAAWIAPRVDAGINSDAVCHSHRCSDPESGADAHAYPGSDDVGSDNNVVCYADRQTDPSFCIRVNTHACPGIDAIAADQQPRPDPGSQQRPRADAQLHTLRHANSCASSDADTRRHAYHGVDSHTDPRACSSADAHRLRAAVSRTHGWSQRGDHSNGQWQRWSHP